MKLRIENEFLRSDSFLEVVGSWNVKNTSKGVIGKFQNQFFIIRMNRQPEIVITVFDYDLIEIEHALKSKKIKYKKEKDAISFPFTFPFRPSQRFKKIKQLVEERCEIISKVHLNKDYQASLPLLVDGLCRPDNEKHLAEYAVKLKKDWIENPVSNFKGILIGYPVGLFFNIILTSILGILAFRFSFSFPLLNVFVSIFCSYSIFKYFSNGIDVLGSRLVSAAFLINSIFSYVIMFASIAFLKEVNFSKFLNALFQSLNLDHKFFILYVGITITFFLLNIAQEPTRKMIPTIERGTEFSKK